MDVMGTEKTRENPPLLLPEKSRKQHLKCSDYICFIHNILITSTEVIPE